MKAIWLLKLVLLVFVASCANDNDQGPTPDQGELIFQSGFEGDTQGIPEEAHLDIIGIDHVFDNPNNWEALDAHPNIGDFSLQYEGGDITERYARIVSGPEDSNNQTLLFWLDQPNVEDETGFKYKGRVQANIYNNNGIREMSHQVRMFLHEDFTILHQAPAPIYWLTVFEYWNNATWSGEGSKFRITVDIQKLSGDLGAPLNFGIHAQTFDEENNRTVIWEQSNTDFDIPIGTWFTVDVYFLEGDESDGRFTLKVTQKDGQSTDIFDIHDFTHHPADPAPNGLGHFNPMKLYTADDLINWVKTNDKTLQIYWDDFYLWQNRAPVD